MGFFLGAVLGFIAWFLARYLLAGLYSVDQNERAVKTSFGRAQRIDALTTLDDPIAEPLSAEHRERYAYPQVRVIPPGGPYFKWPWEEVHKVGIATETVNMAWDPQVPTANQGGTVLEAVTKDQLNTGLRQMSKPNNKRKEDSNESTTRTGGRRLQKAPTGNRAKHRNGDAVFQIHQHHG